MAEHLAFDAGKVTAQGAVARIRRILNSKETDDLLEEILQAAETVLLDIPPNNTPAQPELRRAANRPPITNADYHAKRRRHGLKVLTNHKSTEADATCR